ncbi:MAG: hypothetical protein NTZ85_06175 [Bacteroidia bacterium]|jgi:ribosomal 50S subunit-associated protein YjgA (DUF615 family)|nr:hypothetical protein [Bacteroidia bacterium]
MSEKIKENSIIKAPFLPELARVIKFSQKDNFYEIELVTEKSNQYFKKMLTPEDMAKIETLQGELLNLNKNPEEFFFLIEAYRIRLAYQFDPLLAINVSQIDPLPHQ